jgi:hypothetical protein
VFETGPRRIRMSDCGRVHLDPDEQVTFVTDSGAEYDVARKSWGFYATPSLNGRLPAFGLRAVLVRNGQGRYYVWLVERGREAEFRRYLTSEDHRVIRWLDTANELESIEPRDEGEARASSV